MESNQESFIRKCKIILTLLILLSFYLPVTAQVYYPDVQQPGKAEAKSLGKPGSFILRNNILSVRFNIQHQKIKEAVFEDLVSHQSLTFDVKHLFNLSLKDSSTLDAGDFKIINIHEGFKEVLSNTKSLRGIDKLSGKELQLTFRDKEKGITLVWSISLHNSCNFIQQKFYFQQDKNADSIESLRLINLSLKDNPSTSGVVDGLPLLAGNMFFGIEHPMSYTLKTSGNLTDNIAASVSPHTNMGFEISTVWGITPEGQLRRGFLYYLEKVRAVPYRPFLHYNSWYDLSWVGLHLKESDCIDRVKMYIDSLVIKRKVHLSAFLWDDGWDNPNKVWQFNEDLPNGFTKLEKISRPYGANMGVWLSPWGGYGESQQERLTAGRKMNPPLGTNANGFSLADKAYFNFFKNTAENFIEKQGVVVFKFDGVGAGNGAAGATTTYQKDIEGLLRVMTDLRKVKPDIYFSMTVGTWPSPYWLLWGDNIWRSGGDFGETGEGTSREKWLNYRDEQVYKNIVQRSELYPLNALMNHGIDVAGNGYVKDLPNDYKSLSEDIWSFFGDGTSLQELYVDPHLLNSAEWDLLAKAIKWSHAHKNILMDVHWVGGNPKDEVYGYAAWNPSGGTLMLRNPTDQPKVFTFSLEKALELPDNFNGTYSLYNVITDKKEGTFISTKEISLTLQPQEVKVMNVNRIKE